MYLKPVTHLPFYALIAASDGDFRSMISAVCYISAIKFAAFAKCARSRDFLRSSLRITTESQPIRLVDLITTFQNGGTNAENDLVVVWE